MKLSAKRLAQWCVQGDHYSIQLDEQRIVFESKHITETVPFSIWDGQCQISRGLLWGKLTMIVLPVDGSAKRITVFGLPWRELAAFAEMLTHSYQDWLIRQQNKFMLIEHEFVALRDVLMEHKGYLRGADLNTWREKAEKLFNEHKLCPQIFAGSNPTLYQTLSGWMKNGDAKRDVRNQHWKTQELARWSTWFENVESSPLNASQREAVLMDDNHNLLLAGAGSGKTSVLMARVRYLVTSEQASPERILMLAFGKKASEEMVERLRAHNLENINVSTFHAFATKVIKNVTGTPPIISELVTDEESKVNWITQWWVENLSNVMIEKRWQKHVSQWSIPGINDGRALVDQANEVRLQKWLWRQLDLLQQQNISQATIKQHIGNLGRNTQNELETEQALSELSLIWPLLRDYRQHLDSNKTLDFNGMIVEATKLLSKKNSTFTAHYDHIMVDEYQDVSPLRLAFLEAICAGKRDRTPALFAVGDDWQAIYRFAGSDVRLTTDYLVRFPKGVIRYLDTTYRFNDMIGQVANKFIQQNPHQLSKPLNSHRQQKKKAVTLIPMDNVPDCLNKLVALQDGQTLAVLIIGRNNTNKPDELGQWQSQWPSLAINYVTAHASKGLEADYTFIVDVNDKVFPSKRTNQGLESALLASDEKIDNAEERRLFYVALTRAKHHCWIGCNPDSPSAFVKELWQGDYPVSSKIAKNKLMKR